MNVLHGALLNVYGKPVGRGGFTFMPADVVLDGGAFSLDFPLSEHQCGELPETLRRLVEQQIDAAWVRARIPNVFGFTPEPADTEKALLHSGFAAVVPELEVCYPFVCTDHYGRSALMFSDGGPEQEVKRSIAEAFWGTLIQDADDLADFEERVYHPGAGVWLNYGCEAGRVYCYETQD